MLLFTTVSLFPQQLDLGLECPRQWMNLLNVIFIPLSIIFTLLTVGTLEYFVAYICVFCHLTTIGQVWN